MLLTIANLDRIGPQRAKNPNRIAIWAYEVSIACSQCSKPEPVVQPPKLWKKIFHRESSSVSLSLSDSSPPKSSKVATSTPGSLPKNPQLSTSAPTSAPGPALEKACVLGTGDEMSRTAMYQSGVLEGDFDTHGTGWGGDEFEGDNGESSLDMRSSESGEDWGDHAARPTKAARLLNTDAKKFKMAALQQAAAVAH